MEIKFIKIKKKQFYQMTEDRGWNGAGTEDDPIIVDSYVFSEFIQLWKIDYYVIFKNCTFDFTRFDYCRNLVIRDSVFKSNLTIYGCKNLELHDCKLYFLRISVSYYNLIKNCIFFGFANFGSLANTFESCYFFKRHKKLIMEGKLGLVLLYDYGGGILMIGSFVGLIFAFMLRANPLVVWLCISVSILLFMLGLYMWIRGEMKKKHPPNIIK